MRVHQYRWLRWRVAAPRGAGEVCVPVCVDDVARDALLPFWL